MKFAASPIHRQPVGSSFSAWLSVNWQIVGQLQLQHRALAPTPYSISISRRLFQRESQRDLKLISFRFTCAQNKLKPICLLLFILLTSHSFVSLSLSLFCPPSPAVALFSFSLCLCARLPVVSSRHARAPKSMHCAVFYTLKINYVYAMPKWSRTHTHTHRGKRRQRGRWRGREKHKKHKKLWMFSVCLKQTMAAQSFCLFCCIVAFRASQLGPPPLHLSLSLFGFIVPLATFPLPCRFPLCVCFLRPIRNVKNTPQHADNEPGRTENRETENWERYCIKLSTAFHHQKHLELYCASRSWQLPSNIILLLRLLWSL